ncbi:hypothetical protein ANN_03368 [Periplaneta americana]|uniref:Secreted protein n=1 Tax=Periplaneta americana TaxID=6978 RepID=A0ABQ8U488_PERAM|nr:hypothetical protein ANN_03368 [Periplaneta americana]
MRIAKFTFFTFLPMTTVFVLLVQQRKIQGVLRVHLTCSVTPYAVNNTTKRVLHIRWSFVHFGINIRGFLNERFRDRRIELRFIIGTHCCERVLLVSVQSAASASATIIKDSRMQLRRAKSAEHKRAAKCTQANSDIF